MRTRRCTWYVRILCGNSVWVSHSIAVEPWVACSRAIREAMGQTDGALAPSKGQTLSIDVRWVGEQRGLFEEQAVVEWVPPRR